MILNSLQQNKIFHFYPTWSFYHFLLIRMNKIGIIGGKLGGYIYVHIWGGWFNPSLPPRTSSPGLIEPAWSWNSFPEEQNRKRNKSSLLQTPASDRVKTLNEWKWKWPSSKLGLNDSVKLAASTGSRKETCRAFRPTLNRQRETWRLQLLISAFH